MKVLLVTGQQMEARVRGIAEKFGYDVFVAPVEIASFVKIEHLPRIKGYDLILFPGYTSIDLGEVESVVGIKTAKGPKGVANLEFVLQHIESVELSKTVPACQLLEKKLKSAALADVKSVEVSKVKSKLLKRSGNFSIGSLACGADFPMRVIAEIVDADKTADDEVIKRAKYYIDQGADIIDIGMSGESPERVKGLIKLLRGLRTPLSIDTMISENITAAIESKIDLIMSLDEELIEDLEPTQIPVTIVPGRKHFKDFDEKIIALEKNLEFAKNRGFRQVIADPILEPINFGLTSSISAYAKLGRKDKFPTLMGVGNVTELTDADSVGMNMVLAGIALECGVSLLFTTEASDKTKGSVGELKKASQMMFLTKKRGTLPKDLGIDLLVYKEKRMVEGSPLPDTKTVLAKPGRVNRDPSGDFTIIVDDTNIIAVHTKVGTAQLSVKGENAKDVCETILGLGLISELGHALYLGRELEKAENALRTRRGYIQDEPLF
jgi:dihydropteroate synthase-like protein